MFRHFLLGAPGASGKKLRSLLPKSQSDFDSCSMAAVTQIGDLDSCSWFLIRTRQYTSPVRTGKRMSTYGFSPIPRDGGEPDVDTPDPVRPVSAREWGKARPEPWSQPFPVRFRPTAERRKGNDNGKNHSEKSTIHGQERRTDPPATPGCSSQHQRRQNPHPGLDPGPS